MVWQQWVYLAWAIFGAITTIGMIGRKRDPITPPVATILLIISAGITFIVLSI
jgi:hypothetical protein